MMYNFQHLKKLLVCWILLKLEMKHLKILIELELHQIVVESDDYVHI